MAEWLATNWFQLFSILCIGFSWAVHYGISTQKWKATGDRVDTLDKALKQHGDDMKKATVDIEAKIDELQASFNIHTGNSDIHVSPTLLKLFDERSDYIKQQFSDTRSDIQRIEALLAKDAK